MGKRSIQWIILLMSVCLVGIISFQAYWIWLNIKEKEKEFNTTISEALYKVEERLLSLEADVFVKSKNILNDSSVNYFEVLSNQVTLVNNVKRDPNVEAKDISTHIKHITSKDAAVIFTEIPKKVEEIVKFDSSKDRMQLIVRYQQKKDAIEEIVEKISWEFAVEDVSLKDRIKRIDLDSILQITFEDYGLSELPFEYAIIDKVNDSIVTSSAIKMGDGINSQYQRKILESAYNNEGGVLLVDFPTKRSYLLNSVWLLMLLSSILTSVMIFTFYFTLKTIYRQKKIAAIKSDFINNMTHELKTPLATISLAIDAILHKDVRSKKKEVDRYGQIIKKENQRMNTQIERVLDMALFDKKDIVLKVEDLDVHQIIREVTSDMQLKVSHEHGSIQLDLIAKEYIIKADRMHFYNIIRNLIDNAIKYSKKEIRITIKTFIQDNELHIKVIDRGIGMNKETVKRIFDRFYRKTEGDIHTTKGFGLGLAYVKEILQKMDAKIHVESILHGGSEFTIIYPLR